MNESLLSLSHDMIRAIALELDPDSLSAFRLTCRSINDMIRTSPLLLQQRRARFEVVSYRDTCGYAAFVVLYRDGYRMYKFCEYADGIRQWFMRFDGIWQSHRECDLPATEYACGTRMWYRRGYYHRMKGPAIEYDTGKREWWFDGIRCR